MSRKTLHILTSKDFALISNGSRAKLIWKFSRIQIRL
jgi:hypothetical protein